MLKDHALESLGSKSSVDPDDVAFVLIKML